MEVKVWEDTKAGVGFMSLENLTLYKHTWNQIYLKWSLYVLIH